MLQVTSRTYKDHLGRSITGNMPIANQGDKGTYILKYECYFGGSLSFNLSISVSAGSPVITLNGANWADFGIGEGDTVIWTDIKNSQGDSVISGTTVVYIVDGNNLTIGAPMPVTDLAVSGEFHISKAPEAVSVNLNLIPKEQPSGIASLIDGTAVTLVNNNISGMSVSDVLPLSQIGNLSGGGIAYAQIKRLADTRAGAAKNYEIQIDFYWWYFLNEKADLFFDIETVAPYVECAFLPRWNNPSIALRSQFKPLGDGNSGFRDENFNQKPNHFNIVSASWTDGTNAIGGFDYSKDSYFNVEVENINAGGFGAKLGLIFFNDIQDADFYSASPNNNNGDYSHLQHTIFSEYADIIVGGSVVSFDSQTGKNGEKLSFTNVKAEMSGANVVFSGKITPNAQFISTFSDANNLEKIFTLLVRCESASFSPSNYSDTVNLTAWTGEAKDYPPILGGYFENVWLYDHADNLIHTY